ncbi:hypothetical protein [Flavobacterium johnsoniae]|uniref:Uncharacterized protein n=1 Tax=Flavobacterium johnsoniae TaxID=986 RepID=A0A1J7BR78_FLAJO|nr:hypothetical protein [Flavobacterium johnsoniae]OIV41195.1 hypothetical protein BKM63_11610 [Flavobacterium johnsoniae]
MSIPDTDSQDDALLSGAEERPDIPLENGLALTAEGSEIFDLLHDEYNIADVEDVYMRINRAHIDFSQTDPIKKILPMAFDAKGDDGLSVDRAIFSSPEDTLNRARIPERNGVLSWNVGSIRQAPFNCDVVYDPVTIDGIENKAHSLVKGVPPRKPTGLEFRIQLRQICTWEIECISAEDIIQNN